MKTLARHRYAALLLLALVAPTPGRAQDASQLTLERIYASAEFESDLFGPARWLADGSGYTTVEISPVVQGLDLVKYDPATGTRQVLVPATRLIPRGTNRPLVLDDYAWSDDGTKLLVFANTVRVWRTNTKGD